MSSLLAEGSLRWLSLRQPRWAVGTRLEFWWQDLSYALVDSGLWEASIKTVIIKELTFTENLLCWLLFYGWFCVLTHVLIRCYYYHSAAVETEARNGCVACSR